jgi:pyridoxal phosphate enzyme (YggS family)
MFILNNYNYIFNSVQLLSKKTNLIVVTKNQTLDNINLLIKSNHLHFGENRVQETLLKWNKIISNYSQIKLHLIGKLQSNKAKDAFSIFHYIHTLDNEKLAKTLSILESVSSKKIKYFIQVNIAKEPQKNGILSDQLNQFVNYCINDLKLDIIGLMCIPPADEDPDQYFKTLVQLARQNNLSELSMGMSNDYDCAIKNGATFIRIGSKIFSKF